MIRSMTGFSWAMTLFATAQLRNLLLTETNRTAADLDAVAEAVRGELGEGLGRMFRAGERWQSGVVEHLVPGSRDLLKLGLGMLEGSAMTLEAIPGQRRAGLELANKLQAFRSFHFVETHRDLASARGSTLSERIAEVVARLGAYHGLWAVEGLGFAHAERAGSNPRNLLRGDPPPARALIPCHTGMGLSLAMRALGAVDPRAGDAVMHAALERFAALCQASSALGCEGMTFEALGLVARTLHPGLLLRVDRLLATMAEEERVGYYWHGVGRGLYFTPSHLPPQSGAWGRALEKARQEPPHETGRRNALAGFAWALTLVNVRHPEVLAQVLRESVGEIFDLPAFSYGVSSALLVWHSFQGRDAYLEEFLAPRSGPEAALWERWVSEPGEAALRSFPERERQRTLDALFRCEPAPPPLLAGVERHRGRRPLAGLGRGLDGWVSRALQSFQPTVSPAAPLPPGRQ